MRFGRRRIKNVKKNTHAREEEEDFSMSKEKKVLFFFFCFFFLLHLLLKDALLRRVRPRVSPKGTRKNIRVCKVSPVVFRV